MEDSVHLARYVGGHVHKSQSLTNSVLQKTDSEYIITWIAFPVLILLLVVGRFAAKYENRIAMVSFITYIPNTNDLIVFRVFSCLDLLSDVPISSLS